jgi:hypothetical protein
MDIRTGPPTKADWDFVNFGVEFKFVFETEGQEIDVNWGPDIDLVELSVSGKVLFQVSPRARLSAKFDSVDVVAKEIRLIGTGPVAPRPPSGPRPPNGPKPPVGPVVPSGTTETRIVPNEVVQNKFKSKLMEFAGNWIDLGDQVAKSTANAIISQIAQQGITIETVERIPGTARHKVSYSMDLVLSPNPRGNRTRSP